MVSVHFGGVICGTLFIRFQSSGISVFLYCPPLVECTLFSVFSYSPFGMPDDRNNLEKLTIAVLSHLPTAVLYVHDLSGECGTSPFDQFITYKDIKERFEDHLWLDVVSKCDLLEDSPANVVEDEDDDVGYKRFGPDGAIRVSIKNEVGVDELKSRVQDLLLSQMARVRAEKSQVES